MRGQVVTSNGQALAIVIRGAVYALYEEKWIAAERFVTASRS
jgi:hypothetical protein